MRWAKPQRRALKAFLCDGSSEHWKVILGVRGKRKRDEGLLEEYRALLESRRRERDIFSEREPLVSVRIATYNRARILVEQTLPSVLAQTYRNFEIVIVGDHCTDDTEERIRALGDSRITFVNLPSRPEYPRYREYFWMTAGTVPMNHALDRCRGSWIAPLDDDDQFTPDHIEVLLGAALERQWEFCYGVMEMEVQAGEFRRVGSYPLRGAQICHPAVIYSTILDFLRYDRESWLLWEPADWNMWRKVRDIGARYGFIDRVVGVHHLEQTSIGRNGLD